MSAALVFDPDAIARFTLVQQLVGLGLTPTPCADGDEARHALTRTLFDLVVCRWSPTTTPGDAGMAGLIEELAACPTPLLALATSIGAGLGEPPKPPGVAAWLPAHPSTEELAAAVRAHAIVDPFRQPIGGRARHP